MSEVSITNGLMIIYALRYNLEHRITKAVEVLYYKICVSEIVVVENIVVAGCSPGRICLFIFLLLNSLCKTSTYWV